MPERRTGTSRILEAADAARELAEALARAGFTLPSLRGDMPVLGTAHVQLGGASADVVRGLAAWIRERA